MRLVHLENVGQAQRGEQFLVPDVKLGERVEDV